MRPLHQDVSEPPAHAGDPAPAELLAFYKALSDPLRLRLAGALAVAPATAGELARALDIDLRTVPRQLALLEVIGVVRRNDDRYAIDVAAMRSRAINVLDSPRTRLLAGATDERSKVLASFFRGDVLLSWPAGDQRKLIVLQAIASRFDARRSYSEAEVNEVLRPLYADYTLLRRALVDYHLMNRHRGVYWLGEGSMQPPVVARASQQLRQAPETEVPQ